MALKESVLGSWACEGKQRLLGTLLLTTEKIVHRPNGLPPEKWTTFTWAQYRKYESNTQGDDCLLRVTYQLGDKEKRIVFRFIEKDAPQKREQVMRHMDARASVNRQTSVSAEEALTATATSRERSGLQYQERVAQLDAEDQELYRELVQEKKVMTADEFFRGRETPAEQAKAPQAALPARTATVTLTAADRRAILEENPGLCREFQVNVPVHMTEAEFWQRYLKSKLFHETEGIENEEAGDDLIDRLPPAPIGFSEHSVLLSAPADVNLIRDNMESFESRQRQATVDLEVHEGPSVSSNLQGHIKAGEVVEITTESCVTEANGEGQTVHRVRISAPIAGWVTSTDLVRLPEGPAWLLRCNRESAAALAEHRQSLPEGDRWTKLQEDSRRIYSGFDEGYRLDSQAPSAKKMRVSRLWETTSSASSMTPDAYCSAVACLGDYLAAPLSIEPSRSFATLKSFSEQVFRLLSSANKLTQIPQEKVDSAKRLQRRSAEVLMFLHQGAPDARKRKGLIQLLQQLKTEAEEQLPTQKAMRGAVVAPIEAALATWGS
mmetsp:Transcript_57865/g.154609  ORF Transcript_57865/g.154609 Transcript_57865/m.154609 type:complete len:550 (+) Transcript_57865:23-1672(+)